MIVDFVMILAADIVFDYRQKVTRSFEYLQGDYYIAPIFMVYSFLFTIVFEALLVLIRTGISSYVFE